MESSFQIAICDCPDINACTLATDVTGRFAVISGRKNLALIDLDGTDRDASEALKKSLATTTTGNDILHSDEAANIESHQAVGPLPRCAPVSKKMIRNSKYEPTSSHFNRHMSDLFAVSTYQVVEIFSIDDLNPSKPKIVLKGHSRAIADVQWSEFDPYLCGSSAADCSTNLWDIRDSRRPTANLTSVSGATLVRFSKTSPNLLATSHEIDVRVWDVRQPNLPLYYIAAHLKKINGMDWSPNLPTCDQEQLITCSQDNTIKLWDLNANKMKPSANLPTRVPAWRIMYTPISQNAIMTSTLPQLKSRADSMALKLWSTKPDSHEQKKLELILGLVGHTDIIVDFDWRARNTSGNSCEIISWSKDQTLRVWRVDKQFIEMNVDNSDFENECGITESAYEHLEQSSLNETHQSGDNSKSTLTSSRQEDSTSKISVDSPTRSRLDATTEENENRVTPDTGRNELYTENFSTTNELKQEFNLINKNIPNIEFEELDPLRRVCLVTARTKSVTCRLKIALPLSYPQDDCPIFSIIESAQYGGEGLSTETIDKLIGLLNETARSQLSRSRNCIEPCLRKFITALQKITGYRKRTTGSDAEYKDDPITLSAQRDHSVPFPHTSGARFCGNLLVCFGRPMIPTVNMSSLSGDSVNWSVETPRSMAQLSAQLDNMRRQGSYNLSHISISYFYYGAMRRAELQNRSNKGGLSGRTSSKSFTTRGKLAQSIISKNFKAGPVLVYDVTSLLGGLSRDLAEAYVFDKDVIKMCRKNSEIAATYNRRDLVQIWSLAELSSEGVLSSYVPNKDDNHGFSLVNNDSDFGDRPWTMHPFGSKLIQSLIDHYVYNCNDVQTAAMLVWTFSSPKLGKSIQMQNSKLSALNHSRFSSSLGPSKLFNKIAQNNHQAMTQGASQKHQTPTDTISGDWNFVNGPETHLYSNSWSDSTMHDSLAHDTEAHELKSRNTAAHDGFDNNDPSIKRQFPHLNILSPERSLQNDLIMHVYAELLYRLNLLNQRAMVLKNIGSNSSYCDLYGDKQGSQSYSPEDRLSNITIQCANDECRDRCLSFQCRSCKKYSLYCSICRLPVRGSCSVCSKCLHGGHVNHFKTWFSSFEFCPTGCGCKCLSAEE